MACCADRLVIRLINAKKWVGFSVEQKTSFFKDVTWPDGVDQSLKELLKEITDSHADKIGTPRYVN